MRLHTLVLVAACGGALAPVGWTQDAPTPAAEPDTVARIATEHQTAIVEYRKAYEAARKAREAIPRPPDVAPFAARVLAVVEATADAAEGLAGVTWILTRAHGAPQRTRALELAATRYVAHAGMEGVAQSLARATGEPEIALLRALLAQSPHAAVQGQACYALAKALQQGTRGAPSAEQAAEIEALFERCAKEFAAAKHWRGSLGTAAEAELYEIRHLVVGKPAPEIEGTDPSGATFKLSDYKGRVVVIDFWGDW